LVGYQNLPCQEFGKLKVGQKNRQRFGKSNVRSWQVLVANQSLAKNYSLVINHVEQGKADSIAAHWTVFDSATSVFPFLLPRGSENLLRVEFVTSNGPLL
jgi:hypothetical protein